MQETRGLLKILALGNQDVAAGLGVYSRPTFVKPYRVIYRVTGSQVIIYLLVDGRRDMVCVLARRLLGA